MGALFVVIFLRLVHSRLTPFEKRRLEGCLCRVPRFFYHQVWDVMTRTPQGIKVGGTILPQQPTMSNLAKCELTFSLLVEEMLNCIHQPEYRQLVVELLSIVSTILGRNPELVFSQALDLEQLIKDAADMYVKVGVWLFERNLKLNEFRMCYRIMAWKLMELRN